MYKYVILLVAISMISCKKEMDGNTFFNKKDRNIEMSKIEFENQNLINKDKNTIRERFSAPKNFEWEKTSVHSYGYFLENFPLTKYGSPIVKFNNEKIANQNLHEAVFDIDVGEKDLQQCADAIIRLRAEYLYKNKNYDQIKFHFTSGDLFSWNDYKNGIRPIVSGNKVQFKKTESEDDSRESFRNYLDKIFTYAGTISQFKETTSITETSELQTGDFVITAGSPGHVVFIAGVSKNKNGKKLFLLGEGFTPAQSISVMKNPYQPEISPWYELNVEDPEIKTSRYIFSPVVFKRYED